MKRLFLSLLVALTVITGAGALAAPAYAASTIVDAKREACEGISGQTGASCTGTDRSLNRVIRAILRVVSVIAGVVAIIMIVIAGFKFTTSGGEAQNITSAKNTLIYAIVGLIVVAAAQFIVRFVLSNV